MNTLFQNLYDGLIQLLPGHSPSPSVKPVPTPSSPQPLVPADPSPEIPPRPRPPAPGGEIPPPPPLPSPLLPVQSDDRLP